MEPKLRIAAITDEFSPAEPHQALHAMRAIGMKGAELRVLWGKNIMDLSADELRRAKELCDEHGMEVMSIASPLLKCVLPGNHEVDTRFQQDVFASKHTYEDQPHLADHAFEIAKLMGARIIRVFSYWRTMQPERTYDSIAKALTELGDKAAKEDLIIGLENEHACNIGLAVETAKMLQMVQHPNVKLVWDPANALVGGEEPYPYGYNLLPKNRVVHVHAKDCHMEGHRPVWGPLGTRAVDWKGQIRALLNDGYTGWVSLETHWPGPDGDKMAASTICGWNLRGLASA
jgi:sugar phosphate isomerase/epimerase